MEPELRALAGRVRALDGFYQQRPGAVTVPPMAACYAHLAAKPVCSRCWLAVRAPGCKPELGARLFGMSPVTLSPTAASKLSISGQSDWSPLGELAVGAPGYSARGLGARLLGGPDSRTADAINWIFCRSSAALRGWPLARRSQLKLMYGDHHQQPQKDCRYNEPDPFLVVREPCMRMIGPVHGQPTFHAAPNPTPYHTSYGLMTEHRVVAHGGVLFLELAASLWEPLDWLLGAPGWFGRLRRGLAYPMGSVLPWTIAPTY